MSTSVVACRRCNKQVNITPDIATYWQCPHCKTINGTDPPLHPALFWNGVGCMIVGTILVLFYWLGYHTTEQTIYNQGLMNNRLVGILAGIAFFFPGQLLIYLSAKRF